MSHDVFDEANVANFVVVTRGKSTFVVVDLDLHRNEDDEPGGDDTRPTLRHLMWLADKTRSDITNAVQAVALRSAAPMVLYW